MRFYLYFFLACPMLLNAQFTVAPYFSNNMVLQRDQPIHVWGKANPGLQITATFLNQKKQTIVLSDSSWEMYLNAEVTSYQPNVLIIESNELKKVFENILIGDVWLCIGQSNMQFMMQQEMHYKEALKYAKRPMLRFYNPTYIGKDVYNQPFTDSMLLRLNQDNFYSKTTWNESDAQYLSNISAIGYYFGKSILDSIDIPIGIINLSIGGAPIETFISENVLKNDKRTANKIQGNWLYNEAIPTWVRIRGQQNVANIANAPYDLYGPNHAFKPGFVYNAGIKPLTKFPIKGILWYQGESNAQEVKSVHEYSRLLTLMVHDYRSQWAKSNLPFYFAQLSSIDTINYKSQLWPIFRDEQRKFALSMHHSWMAVTSDLGLKNDVHPTNKKLVGERLALLALNKTYSKNIISSGPAPIKAKYVNNKISIKFKNANEGLMISDSSTVNGFSIDGVHPIDAYINKNKILIKASSKPQYVYFGWQPFSMGNLVNKKSLPTSTFKIAVK